MPDDIPAPIKAELERLDAADAELRRELQSNNTEVEGRLAVVESDLGKITDRLDGMATRGDVDALRKHFDANVIGLLRESLHAVPEWVGTRLAGQSNRINMWIMMATAAGAAAAIVEALKRL